MFALLNTLNVLWLAKLVAMARGGDQQLRKQSQQLRGTGGQMPAAARSACKLAQHPGVAITAFAGGNPKHD